MSGEIEAAGALATAGMAAKAIEGGGKTGPHEGACRNCEAPLEGAYCHACGQPAHISRTLGDVLHDFMHSVLHFDTKAWRTLPMLVVRPGTLTNQYIHGKRARFISPLALFLFTIFLMFFVFSVVGGAGNAPPARVTERLLTQDDVAAARKRLDTARQEETAAAAALARVQKDTPADADAIAGAKEDVSDAQDQIAGETERLQDLEKRLARQGAALALASERLASARKEVAAEAPALSQAIGAAKDAVNGEPPSTGPRLRINRDPKKEDGVVIGSGEGRWQDEIREAAEDGRITVNFGNRKLDEKVKQSLLNPDLALYKLQQTTYKFSFLLVPISLPFIALLFLWRRGVTFFDHVIFSLYSLSFMSLLFLVVAMVGRAGEIGEVIAASAVCLVPPMHMFFHLGGTYRLKLWSALWRTALLLLFVILAASLFFTAILYLGLAI